MDLSSPLAMQFKEFDADGDNKLSPDEVYQLLKLLGKNIYKGSVSSAAKMLNYADDDPATSLFTFSQFQQFFNSLENPLRHDIWKGKYKVLSVIKQIRDATNKKEESSTAAPGAKPVSSDTPFKGDIQITVGPVNTAYDSFIHVVAEKSPKAESKPFIKIAFEQGSNEKAKLLEEKFKNLQTSLFELMKSNDPESAEILDYIHIITNVADTKLNIFVTTSNQALIELGTITADFVDQILGSKLEAKLQFKHEFCVDISKFIDKDSDYSFYHALTKNYHTKLVWNAINFKESSKQIFKALELFKDLKYDKMQPFSLLLIGILHTELCQANFVFDNADTVTTELESKHQILKELGQLYAKVNQENQDLGIIEAIQAFHNKCYVQASIGDWKVQLNVQIKDLKELFSSKIAPQSNPPQQSQPPQNIQSMGQKLVQLSAQKQLSEKSSSSVTSKKKKKLEKKNSLKNSNSSSSLKKPHSKPAQSSEGQEKKVQPDSDSDSD